MSKRLPNYLKAHRLRKGLTQKDVATLLSSSHGTVVSRLELRKQLPSLKTALALELILGAPLGELFAGIQNEVALSVKQCSENLFDSLCCLESTPVVEQKLKSLESIIFTITDPNN